MKIKILETYDHPVLGNLKLDFTNEKGEVSDTVIFAGDNGCGKTTILNILADFTNPGIKQNPSGNHINYLYSGKIHFCIVLSEEEMDVFKEHPDTKGAFHSGVKKNELNVEINYETQNWDQIKVTVTDQLGCIQRIPGNLLGQEKIKQLFKAIYSTTEVNFAPTNIQSTTARDVDESIVGPKRSSPALATEITQLLVDISSVDDAEVGRWVRNNPGQVAPAAISDRRMKRFSKAFHQIFPHKKLVGVETQNNQKIVIFKENKRESDINQLSSGEKQIVFRGGFLLKDINSTKNAIVLVDEPEISLHPKWQQKILEFYRNLFRDEKKKQTAQIFIATHSPYIIQSAKNTCVCILKKNHDGVIHSISRRKFFGWTPDQLTIHAFGLSNLRPDEVEEDLKKLKILLRDMKAGEVEKNKSKYDRLYKKLSEELIGDDSDLLGAHINNMLEEIKNRLNQLDEED